MQLSICARAKISTTLKPNKWTNRPKNLEIMISAKGHGLNSFELIIVLKFWTKLLFFPFWSHCFCFAFFIKAQMVWVIRTSVVWWSESPTVIQQTGVRSQAENPKKNTFWGYPPLKSFILCLGKNCLVAFNQCSVVAERQTKIKRTQFLKFGTPAKFQINLRWLRHQFWSQTNGLDHSGLFTSLKSAFYTY